MVSLRSTPPFCSPVRACLKIGCPGAPFWMDTSFQDKTNSYMEQNQFNKKLKIQLVGGFKHFWNVPSLIWDVILPIDELHHF